MYGGIMCFKEGTCENKYYLIAKEKPSPISKKFNEKYFHNIVSNANMQNKSVKFLLATEQRIPGLGNGVLQDILFNAKIHPKMKVADLSDKQKDGLFYSIKNILSDMVEGGGRDTEKDLFGNNGSYTTKLSKNTSGLPCINCGSLIEKENYMGGSIYYCSQCQELR
jgi:formamidopyrimidine-DNA glycosylase